MTAKALKEAMRRSRLGLRKAQEEVAQIALEIDATLKSGKYHTTPEELQGIDRGLKVAEGGCFASNEEIEAIFVKHRRTCEQNEATDICVRPT